VHIDINAFAALSTVAQLNELTLGRCAASKAGAHTQRIALAALAQLTALTITDTDEVRLTAAEGEPLTQWILARCPKLTPASITQNLL
jgi:hypothetical protein